MRPRDAASLVPLRQRGATLEVLMGQRARRHRFMPDMYVFPGGRVDAADHRVVPSSPLRPAVEARLALQGGRARARALAVAAVRETWEETGVALGTIRQGSLSPALGRLQYVIRAITPPDSPIRYHARFFTAHVDGLDGELRGNGELLDLAWRPVAECLRLPVADITEYILAHLPALIESGARGASVPLFSFRRGRATVR